VTAFAAKFEPRRASPFDVGIIQPTPKRSAEREVRPVTLRSRFCTPRLTRLDEIVKNPNLLSCANFVAIRMQATSALPALSYKAASIEA